jgi:hypothetical protein
MRGGVAALIVSGTPVGLVCIGNSIAAWYYDGGTYKLTCQFVDTDAPEAGYLGIELKGTVDNVGLGGYFIDQTSPLEEKERYLWYRAHGLSDPCVPQENWPSWTG